MGREAQLSSTLLVHIADVSLKRFLGHCSLNANEREYSTILMWALKKATAPPVNNY